MVVEGAKVYFEGVGATRECQEKVRSIISAIKTISPSSEVSLRFLKNGKVYEALLWGKANNVPLGVYRKGPSLSHVLDHVYQRVKKDCQKIWRQSGRPLAMAG